ncbi:Rha family transcriptional regulator [Pseudomonas sp. GL-B-19]|uniref:Rha family transcriptional regulator n=1 Tax=Pseudomonas sp. GL-B-19 TaxID=2832393 RepID=UPI001CBC8557|nr:Rha family transcriptional regulator [Pseudomonas sp. GL-B-19]
MKKDTSPEEKRSLSHGNIVTVTLAQSQGEPRVDSRVLAEQLGTQHKSSIELIDKYADKIRRFGHLPFQTEVGKRVQGGGKAERFALLNEDQAFLLLALSRNTDRVVELKSSLVMAFREARYGMACQTLQARIREASQSGRRLAHWRYEKPGAYQHVAHLREQLQLTLGLEDVRP